MIETWITLIERLKLRRDDAGQPRAAVSDTAGAHDAQARDRGARTLAGVDLEPGHIGKEQATRIAGLPAGVRMPRIAFDVGVQALAGRRDMHDPAGLFPLPDNKGALVAFLAGRAGLDGEPAGSGPGEEVEAAMHRFYGFRIDDVADDLMTLRTVDPQACVLLLGLDFDAALARRPSLGDGIPRYPRLARGLLDAMLMLAELERLRTILGSLATRLHVDLRQKRGKRPFNSKTLARILMSGETMADMADDAVVAHLSDSLFHVETLLWCVEDGPASIDPTDALLAMLADGGGVREALRHPEGRGRLAGRLKAARSASPNGQGRVMPVGLARFMGLGLLDTASVGLIEIGLGVARIGNARTGATSRPTSEAAFWCLFMTILGDVDASLPDSAVASSRRGPARSQGHAEIYAVYGKARMRRTKEPGGLLHIYLPPAGTPVGAARFVPGHWLSQNRHAPFWRGIVAAYRAGGYGGIFDRLPAEWRPAMLARVAALRQVLRAVHDGVIADDGEVDLALTAAVLAALFTAINPLTSDPLLLYVLTQHSGGSHRDWHDARGDAYRGVGAGQRARANGSVTTDGDAGAIGTT